jgi:hypothetical protein
VVDGLGNKRGDIPILLSPFIDWSVILHGL